LIVISARSAVDTVTNYAQANSAFQSGHNGHPIKKVSKVFLGDSSSTAKGDGPKFTGLDVPLNGAAAQ